MPPRIHLIRHAQGHHQLEPTTKNALLPDPSLTPRGISQCKSFAETFPLERFPIDLVCASPLRRTIQTAIQSFPASPKPIVLLPYAQEASDLPSDTGSDRKVLEGEFGDVIDAGMLEEDWNGNRGVYAPDVASLKERARRLRCWLRERGGEGAPYWQNTEWRTYTFAPESNSESRLVEEEESVMRRELPN
ncbi:hypothetical protein Q7P37_008428 [Cladosporium fusiforme]